MKSFKEYISEAGPHNYDSDVDYHNAQKAQTARYNHKMTGGSGIKLTQAKIDKINAQTRAMQQANKTETK
jgi:hypothetical protein